MPTFGAQNKTMKVGIFFGGQSLEREVSFAGGRTIYDNLDKSLFEAVLVFVDSLGNFILLDWQYIYKGSIRDFFPPNQPANELSAYIESMTDLDQSQIDALCNQVGKRIFPHEFKYYFDFAFLALHGPQGEDGAIQGLLQWHEIPYSGSSIFPSAFGINKALQKQWFKTASYRLPKSLTLSYGQTYNLSDIVSFLGLPLVVKPCRQGSSIGVSVVRTQEQLPAAIEKAFFIQKIAYQEWVGLSERDKNATLAKWVDVRSGFGLPLVCEGRVLVCPKDLRTFLDQNLTPNTPILTFEALHHDSQILLEEFIYGKEFSCIVIEDFNGRPIALPPTEILKKEVFFDYRSKYLPGMARKITPIDLPQAQLEAIIQAAEKMFVDFNFDVYARIDGFISNSGEVFLNDPNTTSGMMPSSFFFHQAAEIGLNPSQFLNYIILTSLKTNLKIGRNWNNINQKLQQLNQALSQRNNQTEPKIKVGVIMGGYSSERHISVESGRNIYEKLASSTKYQPIPIFLTQTEGNLELYQIPVNFLLKDNADDIAKKIKNSSTNPIIDQIKSKSVEITHKFAGSSLFNPVKISFEQLKSSVDKVFIALHGRPGEDGELQRILQSYSIPFNGSGPQSASTTIDKFATNAILRQHGIKVANHKLCSKTRWIEDKDAFLGEIERDFTYPIIAKPHDDGCSTGVKKITNSNELLNYAELIFRDEQEMIPNCCEVLKIQPSEEFPQKQFFLIEEFISKGQADHFLEVTGGFLVRNSPNGKIYEMFEASEALAVEDILSLEEKFLAGEGQNITPARYSSDLSRQQEISQIVKNTLQKAAEILQIEGYARIDAFVKIFPEKVDVYIIEVNSLPGMTPATVIFHQAALAGYKPYEFIDAILENTASY
jgi:D-alanine-D-alanine ligase